MTRKDYRAVGMALHKIRAQTPRVLRGVLDDVALGIAEVFEHDNPDFDRERFLRFVETGKDSTSRRRR